MQKDEGVVYVLETPAGTLVLPPGFRPPQGSTVQDIVNMAARVLVEEGTHLNPQISFLDTMN